MRLWPETLGRAARGAGARRRALAGKVVLLTGAAGGIGRELARQLGASGAHLALCDLDAEPLAALGEELAALEVPCSRHAFDITDEAACDEAVAAAIERWGGLDVVINNAGITHRSLFADTQPAVIEKVMAVNFMGAVYCTKAALPAVVERAGLIVATSSVAGFAPLVGRTGYSASKHALHGFFDTLRAELAPTGVDVMLVCPSFTDTPIEANALSGRGGRAGDSGRIPIGGMLAPEDLADRIVDAIARRQRLLLPTAIGKVSWWVSRLAPSVFERLMRRSQGEPFGL